MNNVKPFLHKKRGESVSAIYCTAASCVRRSNVQMPSYVSSWYLSGMNMDELTHCCNWKISFLRIEAVPRVCEGFGLMMLATDGTPLCFPPVHVGHQLDDGMRRDVLNNLLVKGKAHEVAVYQSQCRQM
jgi:hypothetical protein